MATFLELFGTKLDRELGTADRTQRFTTVLRKEYVNEGALKFVEHTGCYTKRLAIPLVDETGEYDLESAGIVAAEDYLKPAYVGASLRITVTASGVIRYIEGDDAFPYVTEETLNQTEPNWRARQSGTPEKWFLRGDTAAVNVGLTPAPNIPATETWALLWPYVAKPPAMTADGDVPFNGRTSLIPYHDSVLAYAAAQCEKLRKDWDAVERQMRTFAAGVAKYRMDQAPPRGARVRLGFDYRRQLRSARAVNPLTGA